MRVRTSAKPAVIGALFESGAEAIQETSDDVITHLRGCDRNALTAAIHQADPGASVEYAPTPNVDWSAAWKSRIGAHRVGRLVVCPPWLADQFAESERVIIEPAMAFGTGEHESTRGVLRLMNDVIRAADTVADLGAGSAVLSIAAIKLGAKRAVGIEMDPDAIGNAEENVTRNGVAQDVTLLEGDAATLLPLIAPVCVVVANIISSVLISLLPVMYRCTTPDGGAILGGMLVDERDMMTGEFHRAGWGLEQSHTENMWWSATLARR